MLNFRDANHFTEIFQLLREENLKELEFPVINFRKFRLTLRCCRLFWKLWRILFHLSLTISEIFRPEVLVVWKAFLF